MTALKRFTLENEFLARTFCVEQNVLQTQKITNKKIQKSWEIQHGAEFCLRISEGTEFPESNDVLLTTDDFTCIAQKTYELPNHSGNGIAFSLQNTKLGLNVTVFYELCANSFYMRKRLEIQNTGAKGRTLEYVTVDSIPAADAFQPYECKQITAQAGAQWKPGLGQPLYTTQSATFWGVEFPAANNEVTKDEDGNKTLCCAYLWGKNIESGSTYVSHSSVFGVGDDADFVSAAFFDYINETRIRPVRLQVQYNSWFDYGGGVSRETFAKSVQTIHHELVEKRACPPLQAYVIDSGWERRFDVLESAWPVNSKFDSDFASTLKSVSEAQSTLGLWLSPGCLFGAGPMVKEYREAGYEALSLSMSMCGPKYMDALQKRMLELTRQGVTFFKLDGVFGHLNTRDFELNGRGCPSMPQLETEGFSANDRRLNDSKYDELKTYYLVAGTERLIPIFQEMHRINPNVYIVISNGAWLSPWWLQHIDTVWMINAGDAAGGSARTEELVYRDGVYYNIYSSEKTQFPMVSLFNHEPKKTSTGESKEEFRKYLFMHLSRGSAFLELYIKPRVLSEPDWDVLAEGIQWAHSMYPAFERTRMHGGDPKKHETYGYSGWDGTKKGYLSVHHPGPEKTRYSVTLDRRLGMLPGTTKYRISTLVGKSGESGENGQNGANGHSAETAANSEGSSLPETCCFGDVLTFVLEPQEIQVLEFEAIKPE